MFNQYSVLNIIMVNRWSMRKERRKVIEVKNLEKTYKGKKTEVKAVDDVSFSVYEMRF